MRLATSGATGAFSQTGLISSILNPSLPAASKNSASRRSPQQIGFIPAQRPPEERNKRRIWTAVCVLPAPVSAPAMKRLTRPALRALMLRDSSLSFAPLTEKFSRHLRYPAANRKHDRDEASSRRRFARDCRCPRYFQQNHSDWPRRLSGRGCPHNAKSLVDLH